MQSKTPSRKRMAPRAPNQKPFSMSKLQLDLERQQENRENAVPIKTIGMSQHPRPFTQQTATISQVNNTLDFYRKSSRLLLIYAFWQDFQSEATSEDTVYDDVINKTPVSQKVILYSADCKYSHQSNTSLCNSRNYQTIPPQQGKS